MSDKDDVNPDTLSGDIDRILKGGPKRYGHMVPRTDFRSERLKPLKPIKPLKATRRRTPPPAPRSPAPLKGTDPDVGPVDLEDGTYGGATRPARRPLRIKDVFRKP